MKKHAKLLTLLDRNEALAETDIAYKVAKQLTEEIKKLLADLLIKKK